MKTISQFTIKGEYFCNPLAQNKKVTAKEESLICKAQVIIA